MKTLSVFRKVFFVALLMGSLTAVLSSAQTSTRAGAGMVAAGVAGWLIAPFAAAPAAIYGLVQSAKAKEELKEQQYRCLTLAMYMDALQAFLEG